MGTVHRIRPSDEAAEEVHGENFTLHSFMDKRWSGMDRRFSDFGQFVEHAKGRRLVLREIVGPAGHRVKVRDGRTGEVREVLMFGSNNYLGLATEPEIVERTMDAVREYGVGCGGPPLLNGTTSLHRELEERLAAHKGCEAAMLFSSGYGANVGWVTGLLQPGDVLVYDAQNHASLYDGIKMGRTRSMAFAHNDPDDLRKKLMQVRWQRPAANVVVCVEGVYSMDGDVAPLPRILKLCRKYGALLAIDEAHSTGVIGATGRGTAEHFGLADGDIDLVMGTFSKVFATTGAFVAASRPLVDFLRFFARSYMFSAALSPAVVASVLAGLEFLENNPDRVARLHQNVRYLAEGLRSVGFHVEPETAILPLHVPAHISIGDVVSRLHDEGLFVNGVEFPAVPKDRQRLRLSVMATFEREDLDFAVDRLEAVGREYGFLGASPGEE